MNFLANQIERAELSFLTNQGSNLFSFLGEIVLILTLKQMKQKP